MSLGLSPYSAAKRVAALCSRGIGHATTVDDFDISPLPGCGTLQPTVSQNALKLSSLGMVHAATKRGQSIPYLSHLRPCYRPGQAASASSVVNRTEVFTVANRCASVMIDPIGAVGGLPPIARDWMVVAENVRFADCLLRRSKAHG